MTKEDFKILMYSLYNNNQLFIPQGQEIEDWINNSFKDSSYQQNKELQKEVEMLKEFLSTSRSIYKEDSDSDLKWEIKNINYLNTNISKG